ncbi:uncharacterized protein [Battus philenor]|uniref:uncharacterized protein n=1 Tax=Battus philenor TaxID=42288 RepID=UPI0035D0C263
MERIILPWMLILCAIPILVTPITISPNGNSPEIKMAGAAMIDLQKDFVSPRLKAEESVIKKNIDKSKSLKINSTKLAINERYRRLIPYMTFYYANDLVPSTTEAYKTKNVEVEKAQILEAGTVEEQTYRDPKFIHTTNRHHSIPRYQGNRLTHFNIASAHPSKLFYNKEGYPVLLQNIPKASTNYNPVEHVVQNDYREFIPKEVKVPVISYTSLRKPSPNFYDVEDVQYYYPEKDEIKYKLVPYKQTPPIKNLPDKQMYISKNTPSIAPIDSIYIKPRPRPQHHYDQVAPQHVNYKKPPTTVSEVYYEKQNPVSVLPKPVIETGFRPIISQTPETNDKETYASTLVDSPGGYYNNKKPQELHIPSVEVLDNNNQNQYLHYNVEPTSYKPQPKPANAITLAELLNSLQINKSIPKLITKENVGSSIRILLQALNALKGRFPESEVEPPVLSSPAPFEAPKTTVTTVKPVIQSTMVPAIEDTDLNEEVYLAEVENPSQHLDDCTSTSQQFPLPITSDEEGGTPGRPGVDYPILTIIPHTKFDCKTQRYKGFFADPETRCQVWHYCDLNGGQASFLCPNGTIFSQAALTCDWWFNVKCSSTAQLYVLNESLYKYILPHSPKFPEDYSGPLVDKYLTLKFKEMEEEFKKNKSKNKLASAKIEDGENNSSSEEKTDEDTDKNKDEEKDNTVNNYANKVSQSSVIVATSGASGNVERLEE